MKGVMRGSGTMSDPYLVEDFRDFKAIGNYTLAYFKQVNDIKVEAGYNPIDINLIRYDGNGYKITGLNLYYDGASTTEGYVTRRYTLGLFGKAKGCGLVNINLENINIEYDYNYTDSYIAVGGLVGEVVVYSKPALRDNNTIKNCSVTGVVKSLSKDMDNWKALSYVGGLIGRINISQGYNGDTQYTYSNKFKGSVTGCGMVGGHIGDEPLTTGEGESTNVFIGEINVLAYSQLGKCKGEQSRAGGFYAHGYYTSGGHIGKIKIRVEDNLTGRIGTISSTGGEWVPNWQSRKIYNRIHYRIGASYATPYFKVNGQDGPNEISVSAGFGIPITNSWNHGSVLNISGQWVKASAKDLITENTFRINIGLTFNERWFNKWKVN